MQLKKEALEDISSPHVARNPVAQGPLGQLQVLEHLSSRHPPVRHLPLGELRTSTDDCSSVCWECMWEQRCTYAEH